MRLALAADPPSRVGLFLMKRIEWGHKLAQRLPAGIDPLQLAALGLSDALSAETKQTIQRAASGTDGIAFLFASPEFQRR